MKLKIAFVSSLILLMLLSSCSTYRVVKVSDSNEKVSSSRGFYYALPKTVISIDVTVNKVEYVPGPYAAFSEKYLSLSNVSKKNSNYYELSNIEIGSYAIADKDNFYFVELPKRSKKKNRIFAQMTELGLLSSVNSFEEITQEYSPSEKKFDYTIQQNTSGKHKKSFVTANVKEKIDTIIEKIFLDTTTIEKKRFQTSMVRKTEEEKAKEASEFIFKLRKVKLDLISGESETPYTENTLRLMVNELDKLEQEYISLFTGSYFTSPMKYHFTYIPEENSVSNEHLLFKFSQIMGLCPADYASGDEIIICFDRTEKSESLQKFVKQKDSEASGKKGFYYRIPELTKVSVKMNGDVKSENNVVIAQFGVTTFLPVTKRNKAAMEFYPNIGAIKKIVF